ncbi:hypothetical protein [Candidatus Accumulibacter sp. ACC007]|uniref:hypothetical protein n=1 Tax=Candidatus Accumulibacter sp. ACC007 TaxID=2823333 RepID=UPI0025B7B9BA|nr:hypothetical protein [Candidatus Accumulibacter sp. ACC007]
MEKMNLTYSAEMMTNHLQAEVISPQAKFEALQSSDGHSLLFSVGTDGAFYLTREASGQSAAGWSKTDLSSTRIKADFSGQSGVTCRTFDAGQSVQNGSLGLAMVVTTSAGDHLYLSLGNSNKDISWADSPNWVSYAYDDPGAPLSRLEIANVFFCETTGKVQYIVVDIVRDPNSTVKNVSRYYIDPGKANGHYWNKHDLPIDIEVDSYDSCLGRLPKGYVDGLYTAGHAGAGGQLEFRPVINVYGSGPPLPVRLNLPGGVVPGAIAATRNADLSTDLFALSGSTLYYFASTNQADGATATPLITSNVLSDTSRLAAMYHDGVITLWGRNASDQVYYTSCLQSQVSHPSAWSVPLPILSAIEEISPYVNRVDGGNTIFASGAGKLQRITQASRSTSKLWQTDQITLPVPPTSKSISFNSYTTTIQVADEQRLPLKNASLSLSANSRCAVYINGLYYIVDSTPIHIKTNSLGSITIVESTETLNGTIFTVSTGSGASVTINPMVAPFNKLAALGDDKGNSGKLKAATINESNGRTRPLVASAPANDLKSVARGLANLGTSFDSIGSATPGALALAAAGPAPTPAAARNLGNDMLVAAGDLFQWLESGIDAVIEVIEDTATAAWHFVATIAGKVYRAILDTAEAVVGAVVWVFNAIKTAVQDIIKFVEFLFEWDDIKRTKDVVHNLTKAFLQGQVDSIASFEHAFDNMIDDVESRIDSWAGIQDWSNLGPAASKPPSRSASNPMQGQNSGSLHLSHHFQNNANNISIKSGAPSLSLVQNLIDDLLNALKQEGQVLDTLITRLETLAHDFPKLSVEDVLKRLLGILVDGVLSSAKVVVDALLKILHDVASAAMSILDAKIHIPIISDILNAIGISDISFLDLFCWISAVAYTVVYKIAAGSAPFPDDMNTDFLINTRSLEDLQHGFGPAGQGSVGAAMFKISDSAQTAVFVSGHAIAGFMSLMSDFVATFEAAEESGENPWGIPSAVMGIIMGGSVGIANFLVPKDPIKQTAVSTISTATTGLVILCKIVFSGPLQKEFGASKGVMSKLKAADGRATGAIVNAVLVIPALACTGWHFYELSQAPAGKTRSDAIIEEVSNLTSYISRVSYTLAVNDDDPESKAIAIGVMAVANIAYSGLQTAEAIVD